MTSIIENVVSEIDSTREEMFKVLESIAAVEMTNDPKSYNKKA